MAAASGIAIAQHATQAHWMNTLGMQKALRIGTHELRDIWFNKFVIYGV